MILYPPVDVAFKIFGVSVYWYGIIMAIAILISIIIANKLLNSDNITKKKDIILSYAPILVITGILGARLYFCLLNTHYYLAHPIEILDIREGGLSIHGAIIAGLICMWFMSKHYKIPFLNLADVIACATPLGQTIGRWGNFFNSEAYGKPILSQGWGLFVPESKRISEYANFSLFHPTFLYESLLNLILFFILFFILKHYRKHYVGVVFFIYLIIYSTIRFFIESLRVDSALDICGIPIAIIMSFILIAIGICGLIYSYNKYKKRV